jgi:transposase-like protein
MSAVDKARLELEKLQAEAQSLRARLSEIDAEILDVEAFIRGWRRFAQDDEQKDGGISPPEDKSQRNVDSDQPIEADEINGPFRGQGLPSAITTLLARESRPMTITEITSELAKGGVRFAAKKPEMSVDWALRRAAEAGQVERIGGTSRPSRWVAVPNPPVPADPSETHSAITRAGLAFAKERGVRLGPPPKVTEEHRLLAKSMFERGATLAEIAKACGVSPGGIGRRIKEWREERRFPEKRRGRRKGTKTQSEGRDRGTLFH